MLLEAEKRGILPEDKLQILTEARKRGLVETEIPTDEISKPIPVIDDTPEWAGKYPNIYGLVGAAKEVLKAGTEMAGMTAGGIVGAPAGPAGVAAGVAVGYGLVKSAERLVEGEKLTGKGLATDLTMGTLFEGVPPAIMKGLGRIIAPYAKKFTSVVTDTLSKETDQYLKAVSETGYTPTAAEIHGGGSKTISMMEGLLGYIPGSASLIYKNRLNNLEKLVNYRNKIIGENASSDIIEKVGFRIKRDAEEILKNTLGKRANATKEQIESFTNKLLTDIHAESSNSVRTSSLAQATKDFFDVSGSAPKPSEMGKATQDVMAQVKNDRYTEAGDLLKSANKKLGGYELETPVTQELADRVISEEMKSSFPNPQILRTARAYSSKGLPPEIQEQVNAWLANPAMAKKNEDVISALVEEYGGSSKKTWSGLDLDVSNLLEASRKANELQGTTYAGSRGSLTRVGKVLSDFSRSIKEDMGNFAESVNKSAYKDFKEGKNLWRETEELFDRDTLKIMRLPPEDVVKVVTPGEVKNIVLLKKMLGEEKFQPFENALIRNIVAFDKDGIINLPKTKVNMNKYGETVNTVLSPQKKQFLDGLITNTSRIEQSYAKSKALTDSLVYDSNGILKLEPTKKKLLTNRELLSQHYTPEEIARIDSTMSQISNINLKAVARNKQEAIEFLGSIVGSDNTGVVKAIVKPHNTININFAKRILGTERTQEIKQEFMKQYLMKTNEFGYYSPASASRIFNNYEVTLKKIMNPDEWHEISNLMQLNKRASMMSKVAENPSQTGQTLIGYETGRKLITSVSALLLGTSIGGAVAGLGSGVAAIAVPYAMARIYLSKAGRQWLTLGYTIPAGTQEASNIIMKLSGIAGVNISQQEEGK